MTSASAAAAEDIREYWDRPGAPVRQRSVIREWLSDLWTRIKPWSSRETYRLDLRDALEHAHVLPAPPVASERAKRKDSRARWSSLIRAAKALLDKFARRGWPVFWASIHPIARVLGVKVRQAWAVIGELEAAGILQTWHRTSPQGRAELYFGEAQSNVYAIHLPDAVWEAWRLEQEESRLTPPVKRPTKPTRPKTAAPRSDHWLPAVFHNLRGADPRYLGEAEAEGGTMRGENLGECESTFEHHARSVAIEGAPIDVAREIAKAAITLWLADPNAHCIEHRHAFGLFARDVERFAALAVAAYKPPKPSAPAKAPAAAPPRERAPVAPTFRPTAAQLRALFAIDAADKAEKAERERQQRAAAAAEQPATLDLDIPGAAPPLGPESSPEPQESDAAPETPPPE